MMRFDGGRLVRLGWAGVLLVAPERVLALAHGGPVPPAAVALARVLGARHLAQGAITAATGNRAVAVAGTASDVLHIGSLLLVAALSPQWRRLALVDAAIEGVVAKLSD